MILLRKYREIVRFDGRIGDILRVDLDVGVVLGDICFHYDYVVEVAVLVPFCGESRTMSVLCRVEGSSQRPSRKRFW